MNRHSVLAFDWPCVAVVFGRLTKVCLLIYVTLRGAGFSVNTGNPTGNCECVIVGAAFPACLLTEIISTQCAPTADTLNVSWPIPSQTHSVAFTQGKPGCVVSVKQPAALGLSPALAVAFQASCPSCLTDY